MRKGSGRIQFHYLVPPFYFPQRRELKRFILNKIDEGGRKVDVISYIFCDDDYLFQMNKEYLKHNTLTDIITFELSNKNQPLLADIYISVERVKENASLFGVPLSNELLRVIFHGSLHLLGYKDKTIKQVAQMRNKEQEYLDEFAISRGT